MDPLSVTLAVVTLATAVKDMVELGQKIHESFAKVSKNLRNAQRIAQDIKEMVEEIRIFSEDHKDALGGMKDFRLALRDLVAKFRDFEASILPLLPQTGGGRRDRVFRGWDAWRNNNKIEGRILELQSDNMKVIRKHMMKSAMRTEVKLETIHQETSRGLMGITQGLEVLDVVRRDVSALRLTAAPATTQSSYESSGTTSDEFNRNVIMFAKSTLSTSAPMLRTPNMITEELMTAAYIKLQVNSIATTLEKMSALPVASSISFDNFYLYPVLDVWSMSITRLRHHVVRQVIDARDLLDAINSERIDILTIRDGGVSLNNLSIELRPLGMDHESMLIGKWAIMLSRTLVDAFGNGQSSPGAYLAVYLLNQSVNYDNNGDKIRSLEAIEEAYAITQTWGNQEVNFQMLYSDVLLQYAGLVDNQRAIKMCVEAVHVLEDILNVQALNQLEPHQNIESVVQPSASFLDNLFSSAPPITAMWSFACALQQLGTSLAIDNQPGIALDCALLAIAVRRKMVSIHGQKHKVDLAKSLLLLVEGAIASHIPADELVDRAEECIQLFRELVGINTLHYARQLVSVLLAKASALEDLKRETEAIATWEEAADIAGQIVQDSKLCATALGNLSDQFRRLERHDDAVRTGTRAISTHHEDAETRAARYFYLSRGLQRLQRFKESGEAAQTSVTLYRHLAMRDPASYMGDLIEGLSDLSHCLAASGDYYGALIPWKESVSMLDDLVDSNLDATSDVIDRCLAALDTHTYISRVLQDEEQCLEVGFTAVRYLRQMSEICPQNANTIQLTLVHAEYSYAYTMLRVGRLQDAQQFINHWLDIWSSKPSDAIPQSDIRRWHALMIHLRAEVLDAQGCTEQALSATQEVHDIVRPFISTYQPAFDEMIESMVQVALLQRDLGTSEDASKIAETALRLSRDNKPEPLVENLVWSLHGVASTALSCQSYTRTAEAAREGCDILAKPEGLEFGQHSECDSCLRPSLLGMLSAAEANLGRSSTALEYAHRAVNASLKLKGMRLYISTTMAEWSYMETRGNLADILLTTGDLSQAREICDERSAYFSKRVEKRAGEYRDLAPVLRMLGVLCCSEGRHEEGEAAAKELSRIMKMLGNAFPSLQKQVKIRLRRQVKVPILKVLNDMSEGLDCKHQAEVSSLFAT